uniref:Myb-like domain-containing protein n=1 Tax=Steinernema glaseri TaxID=37863 RepID=A0A1I8AS05_9BILA
MASSISAVTPESVQAVSQTDPSMKTPTRPQDSVGVHSRGSSSTNKGSGKRKKKKKRAKDPKDFELWRPEDKQCYIAVTNALRHWKATRRQCRYVRTAVGRWEAFRIRMKGHPAHAHELHSYSVAVKEFVPVPEGQSFDLPD